MKKLLRINRLWLMLTGINFLALSYPIMLLHLANRDAEAHLCAVVVLIGCVFLLTVVDVIGISIANEVDIDRNQKR